MAPPQGARRVHRRGQGDPRGAWARGLLVLDEERGQRARPRAAQRHLPRRPLAQRAAAMFGRRAALAPGPRAEDALDALRLGRVPLDDALARPAGRGPRRAAGRCSPTPRPARSRRTRGPRRADLLAIASPAWRAGPGPDERRTCSTRWASTRRCAPSSPSTRSTACART